MNVLLLWLDYYSSNFSSSQMASKTIVVWAFHMTEMVSMAVTLVRLVFIIQTYSTAKSLEKKEQTEKIWDVISALIYYVRGNTFVRDSEVTCLVHKCGIVQDMKVVAYRWLMVRIQFHFIYAHA